MPIRTFTLTDSGTGDSCTFEILNIESLNQQWGLDDSRITVQYKIPWADRFKARRLLLGRTSIANQPAAGPGSPAANVSYLSRTMPHAWIESPEDDVADTLYATKITNTKGNGPLAEPTCYEEAHITVTYENLPYPVIPDSQTMRQPSGYAGAFPDEIASGRWIEVGPRTGEGRIIQTFGRGMVYSDNNKPVMNGFPFPYYEETFTLIWHQVPWNFVPWSRLTNSVNKINTYAFNNCSSRTVMYVGFEPVVTRLPNSVGGTGITKTRAVNIKLKFKVNRNRWDYLPDPVRNPQQWYPVVSAIDNTKTLFEVMDLDTLFRA